MHSVLCPIQTHKSYKIRKDAISFIPYQNFNISCTLDSLHVKLEAQQTSIGNTTGVLPKSRCSAWMHNSGRLSIWWLCWTREKTRNIIIKEKKWSNVKTQKRNQSSKHQKFKTIIELGFKSVKQNANNNYWIIKLLVKDKATASSSGKWRLFSAFGTYRRPSNRSKWRPIWSWWKKIEPTLG